MTEELDVNKMAAEFVNSNLESIYNTGKDVLKGATDSIRLRLNNSYKDYLSCVVRRYSKAKSFLIRDEPTYLYNFYVPVSLVGRKSIIEYASLSAISEHNSYVVITGGGGSGKSMLMRHLLLNAIEQKQKVPIFIELRKIDFSEQTLLIAIQETLKAHNFELDNAYIDKAMKAGHFAFLFDGYDEIGQAHRKSVSKQLVKLIENYEKNFIVLSSRPDDEFLNWPLFSVLEVAPLSLEQACSLIEMLPIEYEFKAKFIDDLRRELFKKHESFLSNPLLLSIMFLTYGQSADIPSKLSLFYNQAYEVLFQRHDAFKGAFQRERLTRLDIQDFARIFSAFSILTYDKRLFQLPRAVAIEVVDKAKILANINVNSDDFLKDAEQAVCLLIEEGLQIIFAHRSFQEYFVARFIYNAEPDVQQKLINKYSFSIDSDSIMELLYEMNPELIERTFIIPVLERIERIAGVKKKIGITHHYRYLTRLVNSINISNGRLEGYYIGDVFLYQTIKFIRDKCMYLVNDYSYSLGTISKSLWEKYGTKNKDVRYMLKKMKPNHEIIRAIYNEGGSFSKTDLELLMLIKNQLIIKHKNLNASLEEIIRSS